MVEPLWQRFDLLMGVAAGVAYGVVAQIAVRVESLQGLYGVMSFGYVFVLPAVLGAISALSLRPERGWLASVGAGLASCALSLIVAFAVGWEGSLCLVMAAPVYFVLATLGALVGHVIRRQSQGSRQSRRLAIVCLLGLPLASASAEQTLALAEQTRNVHNSIDIAASPAAVWQQIIRVPPIREAQHSWFFTMGFPRPVEATLSHEGVGGVRHARFERGLLFVETVTHWQPRESIRFDIAVDPQHTPLTTLDTHVSVGGRYFDVLEGGYRIEPLGANRVRLHLDSRHRISTRFNVYTSLWSDALMSEIQRNILAVVKARAER